MSRIFRLGVVGFCGDGDTSVWSCAEAKADDVDGDRGVGEEDKVKDDDDDIDVMVGMNYSG